MSPESTSLVPTTAEDYALLLASLREASDADNDALGDVRLNKLVPRLVLSKDTTQITVKLGDQIIEAANFLYVSVVAVRGSRALFPWEGHPAKDDYKQPICSTGLASPRDFNPDTMRGSWLVNPDFVQPYGVKDAVGNLVEYVDGDIIDMECARCPYNVYGSQRTFAKKDSNAKVCGENRQFFVRILVKIPTALPTPDRSEVYPFKLDERYETVCVLPLGMGSHSRVIEDMVLKARSMNLPFSSAVFKIGVRHEVPAPGIKYPVLTHEFAGFPLVGVRANMKEKDLPFIAEYVERNGRKLAQEAPPF